MNDFNEVQIVVLAAQEMSFTRAAIALGISKAAVSRAVLNLETRLGTRLFERTTRRLALTEAGETYLVFARRAIQEAEDGEAAVSKLNAQPRGTLRVALPVTLARLTIAPKLAQFLKTYPELRIEMTLRGGQIHPLNERVDVVYQTTRPEMDSQIIQKRIQSVNLGIYASKTYLKTASPIQTPQDLAHHSCLTLTTTRAGTTWRLHNQSRLDEVRLRGRVSVGDPLIHQQLCLDGAGIAVIPEWAVRGDLKAKRLVRVLPDWTPSPIELYVLYATRLSMTPKLNAFLKFVESII